MTLASWSDFGGLLEVEPTPYERSYSHAAEILARLARQSEKGFTLLPEPIPPEIIVRPTTRDEVLIALLERIGDSGDPSNARGFFTSIQIACSVAAEDLIRIIGAS
jgi:hypothetical protein